MRIFTNRMFAKSEDYRCIKDHSQTPVPGPGSRVPGPWSRVPGPPCHFPFHIITFSHDILYLFGSTSCQRRMKYANFDHMATIRRSISRILITKNQGCFIDMAQKCCLSFPIMSLGCLNGHGGFN